MNRVYEEITRRQMKQVKINVLPELAEEFKNLCKEQNTSMNQVLEDYMVECLRAAGKIK